MRVETYRAADLSAIASKVQKDILFLEDRLQRLSSQHNPNQTVVRTYRDMLDSRLNVLSWLQSQEEQSAPAVNH